MRYLLWILSDINMIVTNYNKWKSAPCGYIHLTVNRMTYNGPWQSRGHPCSSSNLKFVYVNVNVNCHYWWSRISFVEAEFSLFIKISHIRTSLIQSLWDYENIELSTVNITMPIGILSVVMSTKATYRVMQFVCERECKIAIFIQLKMVTSVWD